MANNQIKKKGSFLKIVAKLLLFVLIVIVLVGVGGYFWVQDWYNKSIVEAYSNLDTVINFEIKKGTSAADIGKVLKDNKLIKDENVWQIYVKLNNPNLLADKYAIPQNLSIVEIIKILEVGQKDAVIWVTIPEGLRMDEIEVILDAKLSSIPEGKYDKSYFHSLINSPDEFLSNTSSAAGSYISEIKPEGKFLEGFLFPDTYAFRTDVNAEDVLITLLENFMAKTKDLVPANGLSFYDNLVIASIVEREANPEDHSGVASVFLKRIEMNEKLGSDITVMYILKRWKPEPTAKELLIESPYNTRKNYGIPPTPISNPGMSAISNTEQAKAGENVFFLADEFGKVHYGKTIADHNKNICKYITKTCQ